MREQLASFGDQLARQTGLPKIALESWPQAHALLANQIGSEKTVVLLDEISWLACSSPDFSGFLKIAWDTEYSKKSRLVLVLCGSVSSWIEKNVLNNTGFVGRVSLVLTLNELPLSACNGFWHSKADRISGREKLKVLSVTGGVPRYLEEIRPLLSAEENIRRLCFTKEGLLFNEFGQIFHDVFSNRSTTYRKIITALADGSRQQNEISSSIDWERGGHLTEYLRDLELSGFISSDTVYGIKNGRATRLTKYRLSDNYLRFYLKCIAPHADAVKKGIFSTRSLEDILPWETICGFQFENIVLNNLPLLLPLLDIHPSVIKAAAPYFQRKTSHQKACQIDLLIHTRHSIYICEIKGGQVISAGIIAEMQEKTARLKIPRSISVRQVLIHAGEVEPTVERQGYFDYIVPFENLLTAKETL
ncbi:MAG: hypothetical protein JXA71_00205 [Chitinispirillaceae bacterium]|nr:hypothetical protein [Chitinispirillaceae bacterium]